MKTTVTVNASKWTGELKHNWNYVGYDECNYTCSPGGMELIKKFGKLEKPYYIRTHHLLCTGNLLGRINGVRLTSILRIAKAVPFMTFQSLTKYAAYGF